MRVDLGYGVVRHAMHVVAHAIAFALPFANRQSLVETSVLSLGLLHSFAFL